MTDHAPLTDEVTDHAPLTEEELAVFGGWRKVDGYLGGAAVDRLIADLRAARAEVERLRGIILSTPEVVGEVVRDALLYGDGWVQNTPQGLRLRDPQAVVITERPCGRKHLHADEHTDACQ